LLARRDEAIIHRSSIHARHSGFCAECDRDVIAKGGFIRTRYVMSLSDASAIVIAAQECAVQNKWQVTIAVVDESGTPILVTRMDDATPASVNTAIEKARSAGLTGLPTKALEAMVRERPAIVSLGRVAVEGGIPVLYKGQKVGGVGVSGVQSDQDAAVAEAGLRALNLSD
jgi:glc operon protein GlcG